MFSYKKIAVSALAGLALFPGIAAEMTMMTGYIMDNLCMNNCENAEPFASCTPDGSNAFYNPQDHTGWCLLLSFCVDSGYSLMSEFPTEEDGRHSVLLTLVGDASQEAALSYIEASTVAQKSTDRLPFPKVTIVYDEELAAAGDNGILQVMNATVVDPWEGTEYFSGANTTQILCPDSNSPDVEANNLCFRSDVVVSVSDDSFVIESNGCPDHDNMMGSNGTIANFQEDPMMVMLGAEEADACNPCGSDACNPCGSDACNPCGSSACGSDACNPCGSSPCGSDACGSAACGSDACGSAACASDACGSAACGSDACGSAACGSDACGATCDGGRREMKVRMICQVHCSVCHFLPV